MQFSPSEAKLIANLGVANADAACHHDFVEQRDNTRLNGAPDDVHSLLVESTAGRIIVAFVVAIVGWWIVAPNMPPSAVRDKLEFTWTPASHAGLRQDWGVFSPNPRNESLDFRARVEHADGTVEFWDIPDFDPIIGAYREYRWNKWQERVRLDIRSDLWPATAEWIAEQHRRNGALPIHVTLIRRWIAHAPLSDEGEVLDNDEWNEFKFFTWEPQK